MSKVDDVSKQSDFFLSGKAYAHLTKSAIVLEKDGHGLKVLQLPDGRIVKLFRIKRWLSSALFYPYSLRFLVHAQALKKRGFISVDVNTIFYCHDIKRHGVIYAYLQGKRMDQVDNSDGNLFIELAQYIAQLHLKGIHFRSLHLGNILRLPGGGFGLIDVADMQIFPFSLFLNQRIRNFQHLLRLPEHRQIIKATGIDEFINAYLEETNLSISQKLRLKTQVMSMLE